MSPHYPEPTGATVLVVAGGKGGTGISLVTALIGLAVAGEGRRVLLVDGTENFGALHMLLGVVPRHPLAALRGGQTRAEELLLPVTETLALFPGGGDELPGAALLSAAERQLLFRRVAELYDGYDLVVVDAGSRLEAVHTACTGGAGHLLLVTANDQITMAATHALLKAVHGRSPELPVSVVVNRSGDVEARETYLYLQQAATRFLARDVVFAGAIPDDACLRGGLGAGMTVQDAAAGSPAALAARTVGLQVLNEMSARTTMTIGVGALA